MTAKFLPRCFQVLCPGCGGEDFLVCAYQGGYCEACALSFAVPEEFTRQVFGMVERTASAQTSVDALERAFDLTT